jgi:hypothetical protein
MLTGQNSLYDRLIADDVTTHEALERLYDN